MLEFSLKLFRFGEVGAEKPGIIAADGSMRDLSTVVNDIGGIHLSRKGLAQIATLDTHNLPHLDSTIRLAPCIAGTGKFICIGLNYADHASETGGRVPTEPVIFMKATSAICGANDPIIIPRNSQKTDWEVELAVVIGEKAHYVSEANALDYIAGYTIANDISERAFQIERKGQWTKGKSCDSFGPIGPYLTTKDEIANPQNLKMWLKVNNQTRQDGTTKTMVHSIAKCVSYLSQFMSLHPGDVISTGTPAGVGHGMNPPQYLKAGDIVELGIEGLGTQRQEVISS